MSTAGRSSEQVSAAERVSKLSNAEQANEERDKRVAQYLCLDSWLFGTIAEVWRKDGGEGDHGNSKAGSSFFH